MPFCSASVLKYLIVFSSRRIVLLLRFGEVRITDGLGEIVASSHRNHHWHCLISSRSALRAEMIWATSVWDDDAAALEARDLDSNEHYES
jgi:hypothetical protein